MLKFNIWDFIYELNIINNLYNFEILLSKITIIL